jgi:hypothetical protein
LHTLPLPALPALSLPAADALLVNKKNKELLAGYDERAAAAVGYMQMVNPSAVVVAGPLTDPKVGPGLGWAGLGWAGLGWAGWLSEANFLGGEVPISSGLLRTTASASTAAVFAA